MIDLRHPMVVLASLMPWQQAEVSVAHLHFRKACKSVRPMPDLKLFGEAPTLFSTGTTSQDLPYQALRCCICWLSEGLLSKW